MRTLLEISVLAVLIGFFLVAAGGLYCFAAMLFIMGRDMWRDYRRL